LPPEDSDPEALRDGYHFLQCAQGNEKLKRKIKELSTLIS